MTRKRCKYGRKKTSRKGCKKKPGPKKKCKKSKKNCRKRSNKRSNKKSRKLNKYIKFANKNRKEVWEILEKKGVEPSRMVPSLGKRLGKMYRQMN